MEFYFTPWRIKEVEYMQGREYLEDGIRANEYEFTENGKRA